MEVIPTSHLPGGREGVPLDTLDLAGSERDFRPFEPGDGNFKLIIPPSPLEFTGERMTGQMEGQIEFEHYHRYCLARDYCVNRDVLDIASGEGYGSALLAGVAASVVGVEIDPDAVRHATANYQLPNLHFTQGDAQRIPVADHSMDVVVSFETLEHLPDQASFILEIKRVLRPDGLLVVSTPDRAVYSAPGSDPNPYHTLELTASQFDAFLGAHFARYRVLSQRPVLGSIVASDEMRWRSYERRSRDVIEASSGLARAHYLIGFASNAELPLLPSSVYLDWRRVHAVMEDSLARPPLEQRIVELRSQLGIAEARADKVPALEQQIGVFEGQIAELRNQLSVAEAGADKVPALEQQIRAFEGQIAELRNQLDIAEAGADKVPALEQQIVEFERQIADLHSQRDTAVSQLEEMRDNYEAIVNDATWRIMRPIRSFRRKNPRLTRDITRVSNVVWWILTLQIGYHIKEWHHRRRLRRAARKARQAALVQSPVVQSSVDQSSVVPPSVVQPSVECQLPAPEVSQAAERTRDLRRAFLDWHGSAAIYFPPVEHPKVSVVIPVYKGLQALEDCLRSLAAHLETEPAFEVILVDDCPAEPVLWTIPESGGLRKISNSENLGFLLTCNRGAAVARGEYLCFLNSDTIVSARWLRSLVETLEGVPDAGLAGSMLLNVDGTIQDAGWRIMRNGWGHSIGRNGDPRTGSYTYRREVDCVTGASFAIRRSVFEGVGGFDQDYAPAFYEEFDLAFRLKRNGLKTIYEPRSRVLHLGSASYGPELRDRLSSLNHGKFIQRFAAELEHQPDAISDEFALMDMSGARPTILVIDNDVPRPDRHAGDVTMSQYLGMLVSSGWRVVFGPVKGRADGSTAEAVENLGIELIRPPVTIEQWLADHGDHVRKVWIARPEIASEFLDVLRSRTTAQIVYYTHDLHSVRMEREAALRNDPALREEADSMRELERNIFRSVDRVSSPSPDEYNTIRTLAPDVPISTIPPYFYKDSDILHYGPEHFAALRDIVFIGGFPHIPNVDAALFIAHEIMPLVWKEKPEARLLLVGYNPPPEVLGLAGERVIVTGQVPKIEPYFAGARVMLAALRYGAGLKGKVVEAMRLGVPVVTTPIGAEGIGLENGRDAFIATDPQDLADAVVRLMGDAELCASLSEAGAARVRALFSISAGRAALTEMFGDAQTTEHG